MTWPLWLPLWLTPKVAVLLVGAPVAMAIFVVLIDNLVLSAWRRADREGHHWFTKGDREP